MAHDEEEAICPGCRDVLLHNLDPHVGEGHNHPAGYWLACPWCDRAVLVSCPPQLLRLVLQGARMLSDTPVRLGTGSLEPPPRHKVSSDDDLVAQFRRQLESDTWFDELLGGAGGMPDT